jgi:hypothetical protein
MARDLIVYCIGPDPDHSYGQASYFPAPETAIRAHSAFRRIDGRVPAFHPR